MAGITVIPQQPSGWEGLAEAYASGVRLGLARQEIGLENEKIRINARLAEDQQRINMINAQVAGEQLKIAQQTLAQRQQEFQLEKTQFFQNNPGAYKISQQFSQNGQIPNTPTGKAFNDLIQKERSFEDAGNELSNASAAFDQNKQQTEAEYYQMEADVKASRDIIDRINAVTKGVTSTAQGMAVAKTLRASGTRANIELAEYVESFSAGIDTAQDRADPKGAAIFRASKGLPEEQREVVDRAILAAEFLNKDGTTNEAQILYVSGQVAQGMAIQAMTNPLASMKTEDVWNMIPTIVTKFREALKTPVNDPAAKRIVQEAMDLLSVAKELPTQENPGAEGDTSKEKTEKPAPKPGAETGEKTEKPVVEPLLPAPAGLESIWDGLPDKNKQVYRDLWTGARPPSGLEAEWKRLTEEDRTEYILMYHQAEDDLEKEAAREWVRNRAATRADEQRGAVREQYLENQMKNIHF